MRKAPARVQRPARALRNSSGPVPPVEIGAAARRGSGVAPRLPAGRSGRSVPCRPCRYSARCARPSRRRLFSSPTASRDAQAGSVQKLDQGAVAQRRAGPSRWRPRSAVPLRPARACAAGARRARAGSSSAAGLSARSPSRTRWRKNERIAATAAGDRRRRRARRRGAPASQRSSSSFDAFDARAAEPVAQCAQVSAVCVDRLRGSARGEQGQKALDFGVRRRGCCHAKGLSRRRPIRLPCD